MIMDCSISFFTFLLIASLESFWMAILPKEVPSTPDTHTHPTSTLPLLFSSWCISLEVLLCLCRFPPPQYQIHERMFSPLLCHPSPGIWPAQSKSATYANRMNTSRVPTTKYSQVGLLRICSDCLATVWVLQGSSSEVCRWERYWGTSFGSAPAGGADGGTGQEELGCDAALPQASADLQGVAQRCPEACASESSTIGRRLPPRLGPGISAAESAAEKEEPADTLGSQGSKCLAAKVVQDRAVGQTVAASL